MATKKVIISQIRKLRMDILEHTRSLPQHRYPTEAERLSPRIQLLQVMQGGTLENESWLHAAPRVLGNMAALLSLPVDKNKPVVPIIDVDKPLPANRSEITNEDLCLLSLLQLKNAFNRESQAKIRTHQSGWTRKTQAELSVKEQKHVTSLYRRYEKRLTTLMDRMM